MRAFFRITAGPPAGGACGGRPGAGPAGLAGRARPGPVGADRPRRLSSYTARPPAAGRTTDGYPPWPQRCSARIHLITCSSIGSAAFLADRGTCQSATFWRGCASVCWRSR